MTRKTQRVGPTVSHVTLRRAVVGTALALSTCAPLAFIACGGELLADASTSEDASNEALANLSEGGEDAVVSVPPEEAAAEASAADAGDGSPACNGVIPRGNCSYTGPSSPPFDLTACGLLPPDGTDAGNTATAFCLEQNPAFSAPINSTRAMPADDAGDSGAYVCVCGSGVPGGRAPHGLELAPRSVDSLGDFFAAAAEAEAASIDGFEILEAELAAHGAPARLLRASRRAAMDERRTPPR